MKAQLHTTLALACLAAILPSQQNPAAAALQRAMLIERQEGDLQAAAAAYRALLQDDNAQRVHDRAAMRLGSLLWRLDRRTEARQLLDRAIAAGGPVADEARAVLQSDSKAAQDAQGREQQAELLLNRIEELLRPMQGGKPIPSAVSGKVRNIERELFWLGDDAARVLVRRASLPEGTTRSAEALQALLPLQGQLVGMMWRIGAKPANDYLLEIARKGPLALQRFVSQRAFGGEAAAAEIVAAFAKVDDPTGEVWQKACQMTRRLEIEAISGLLTDPALATRSAGVFGAASKWHALEPHQRATFYDTHVAAIESVIASGNPRLQEPAWSLLGQFATNGPTACTHALLQHLESVPVQQLSSASSTTSGLNFRVTADDRWIAAAAAASRRIPAKPRSMSMSTSKHQTLAQLVAWQTPSWTEAATDDIATLLLNGYIPDGGQAWFAPAIARMSPAQTASLVSTLPARSERKVELLTHHLAGAKTGKEWFPAIRDVVDACLRDDSIKWRARTGNGPIQWSDSLRVLLDMAGRSTHPDVGVWLLQIARQESGLTDHCIAAILNGARKGDKALHAMLPGLLAESRETLPMATFHRAEIFGALAMAGDVDAIDAMVTTYGVGHPGTETHQVPRKLDYLLDQDGSPRHGYDDDALRTLWTRLLQGDDQDLVWFDLTRERRRATVRRGNRPSGLAQEGKRSRPPYVPAAALEPFAQAMPSRWLDSDRVSKEAIYTLRAFHQVTAEHLANRPELASAIRAAIQHVNPDIGLRLFVELPKAVVATFADTARAVIRRHPSTSMRSKVIERVTMEHEDWLALLRAPSSISFALQRLPNSEFEALRPEIEALVQHDVWTVRADAADALARMLGERAVPFILPLLSDKMGNVRERATTQLDKLREIRSQTDYWQKVGKGIDTSPAGAAAKLIAQAMPGQDAKQRVLAIRSLAVLRAPESLPYLIEWTKDADPTVQTAANEAITAIHKQMNK